MQRAVCTPRARADWVGGGVKPVPPVGRQRRTGLGRVCPRKPQATLPFGQHRTPPLATSPTPGQAPGGWGDRALLDGDVTVSFLGQRPGEEGGVCRSRLAGWWGTGRGLCATARVTAYEGSLGQALVLEVPGGPHRVEGPGPPWGLECPA